uniref:Schlafen family member 8-like n=1 Tax=Nannospalax galili TaxID=1026970 RepID=A0A8C6RME5_NANGA
MSTELYSLVVQTSHPDLVIDAGVVTLGEENRKKLDAMRRREEKLRLAQASCALLNSGGGVIKMEMANKDEHPVELGLDLEKSLRELIQSSDLQAFFETKQQGRQLYIFVKSWNCSPEDGSTKPRICSLSSSLYRRSETSVLPLDSREAFSFLKKKKSSVKCSLMENGAPPRKNLRAECQDISELDRALKIFQRERIDYGHKLAFSESTSIEFKQFSTKCIQEYVARIIPEYIPAFANTRGGYLFIGVDDKSKKVLGCKTELVDRDSLETVIAEAISKLPIVHLCSSEAGVSFRTKFIDVYQEKNVCSYLCAIKVEPFCCAVFSEAPKSWMVNKEKGVYRLTAKEWVGMMMDADPGEKGGILSEDFECQLSLSTSPPCCRPVYSRKGLEHKANLQQCLFPVSPGCLQYIPDSLWKELSSEHQGLETLISQEIHSFSCQVLIFSRSWAMDLDLKEKQGVICDALLIAEDSPPILYTILGEQDAGGQDYCTHTAFTLKQKLVNTGGYTGKLCVMTKVLCLSPQSTAASTEGSACPIHYPSSYNLADTQEMEALLQALVLVLLSFRSFLSDQLGCEILNLLTAQQYEILSKNLHKTRDLFVHGLPGSGKTVMALKIMEKIRNTFPCETNRILYICENERLRDFISSKNICKAVTRKTFMIKEYHNIQHIIIDEAQNFRTEDGDWYEKAKAITQREQDCPGILWIFLDYFQTSHLDVSGLPLFSRQYPREELTRVVRNADNIARYLQEELEEVRNKPPPNLPPGSLGMLREFNWAQGVSGSVEIKSMSLKTMMTYVAGKCQFFLSNGYSLRDIAVLFSTVNDVQYYKDMFLKEMRKRKMSCNNNELIYNHDMFDSVRRFSGLERSIVFGIDPRAAEPAIFHNLLLCLASRARKHLYILRFSS